MSITINLDNYINVFLCSSRYLFTPSPSDNTLAYLEACISFVTEYGFFAAIGHKSDSDVSHPGVEVYSHDDESGILLQAGQVLCSTTTGTYGAFYDDYTPPVFAKAKIASLDSIKINSEAELWMPVKKNSPQRFLGKIVAIFPDKPFPVLFKVEDNNFPGATFGCSGCVILQDGSLVAVMAGANENPANLLYCTSAEQMIKDLEKMLRGIANENSLE